MGKITVKHIIVPSTLKADKGYSVEIIREDGSTEELFSSDKNFNRLYVKVSFNRKTTQFKSMVEDNVDTIEYAINKYGSILNSEKNLIIDLVEKGFNAQGDKFNLKGLYSKVREYNRPTYTDILLDRISDLEKILFRIDSPYKDLKIYAKDLNECDPLLLFDAYLKLFDNHNDIKRLYSDFNSLGKYYELMILRGHTSSTFIEWKYGEDKFKFIEVAKLAGLNLCQIREVITFIDNSINHIIKE